ncbi:MAG: ABC transporter permease [Caldisericia bacterium]|nr:ABC transporter permease [Caldisericia bacterium]
MMTYISDVCTICYRELIKFFRQKTRIFATIIQPLIWLGLMGNTMSRLTNNPFAAQIFGTSNYLSFMTPGIVIMTSLFGGIFGGSSIIWDRRIGYLDKLLTSPIERTAISVGKALSSMIQAAIQSSIILLIAYIFGVRYVTGIPGVIVIIFFCMLFTFIFAGLSLIIGTTLKTIETFFTIINFFTLPITFSSTALFPLEAMPKWLQFIARINPLSYAVNPVRTLAIKGWEAAPLIQGLIIILLFDAFMFFLMYLTYKRLTSE